MIMTAISIQQQRPSPMITLVVVSRRNRHSHQALLLSASYYLLAILASVVGVATVVDSLTTTATTATTTILQPSRRLLSRSHHGGYYDYYVNNHHSKTTTTTTTTATHKIRRRTTTSTALFCQLLGMNCATPTDFTFSFQGFCKRGGDTDVHADGWGVVFYQDGGIRQFHDVEPASRSPLAQYLGSQSIQTHNMMGHIRYATQGKVNLANQHPFTREMWGLPWCFCHNGEVPLFSAADDMEKDNDENEDDNHNSGNDATIGKSGGTMIAKAQEKISKPLPRLTSLQQEPSKSKSQEYYYYYHPVGTTDSEATFCAILNALRCQFTTLPSLPVLHQALLTLCTEIALHDPDGTILNFLLTCGPHTQWVYSWPGRRPGSKVWNGLHYTVREYPFSKSVQLSDMDYTVDFSAVTGRDDCVSVIATKPLTDDEEWTELERGQLIVFDQGKPWHTPYELFQLELLGHGLHSTVLQKSSLEDDMKHYNLNLAHFFQGECI